MRVRRYVSARVDRFNFSFRFQCYPSLVSRACEKAGSRKLHFDRVHFPERLFRCEEHHTAKRAWLISCVFRSGNRRCWRRTNNNKKPRRAERPGFLCWRTAFRSVGADIDGAEHDTVRGEHAAGLVAAVIAATEADAEAEAVAPVVVMMEGRPDEAARRSGG